MQVRVLFLGPLRELAGKTSDVLKVPEGATVEDLLRLIEEGTPGLKAYSKSMAIAVNQEYASLQKELFDHDEIGLLPPVSGGSDIVGSGTERRIRACIVHEKIDSERAISTIQAPEDGAVVTFEGVVRDNSRGRRTVYLEYEAYEEMASREMERLVEDAIKNFAIRDAVVIHRTGRLEIGETSVLIVVASAHRAAAFEACRWMIDQLKKTVPIWKKECFKDGAVWADGEPFPAEIALDSEG